MSKKATGLVTFLSMAKESGSMGRKLISESNDRINSKKEWLQSITEEGWLRVGREEIISRSFYVRRCQREWVVAQV